MTAAAVSSAAREVPEILRVTGGCLSHNRSMSRLTEYAANEMPLTLSLTFRPIPIPTHLWNISGRLFTEAVSHPDIVALSIGTRPDCLGDDVLELLSELNEQKPVWVELGLQTMHDSTAAYIRRGYPLSVFEDAVRRLRALDLEVIVHTILGLPGETKEDILKTVSYLNTPDIQGIKLQLLHILKGTDLAKDYEEGRFSVYTMEEYIDLVIACLEHLSPRIVIHRLTGDGPKELLLAPLWSSAKKTVLNTLHHECKVRGSYQGRLYTDSNVHQMA